MKFIDVENTRNQSSMNHYISTNTDTTENLESHKSLNNKITPIGL